MRHLIRGAIALGAALTVVLVAATPAAAATAIEYGLIAAIIVGL